MVKMTVTQDNGINISQTYIHYPGIFDKNITLSGIKQDSSVVKFNQV